MTEQRQPENENSSRIEMGSSDLIVVHNAYFAKPGLAEAVYQWRLHASDVRVELGFPRGRVLRQFAEPDDRAPTAWPDVIWECTYPSLEARQHDAKAVESTPEFQAVMRHMRTLIRRFDRQIWRVSSTDA